MNRNITLILSAVVVVILLAIWLYLMFFSTSNTQDPIEGDGTFSEFSDLGEDAPSGGEDVPSGEADYGSDATESEGYDPDILRQLTTKNVVGYREIEIASTTHIIFMESGVGHVYSINLETGEEARISATTIPNARAASFSSNGLVAAVKTGGSIGINPVSLAYIDLETNSLESTELELVEAAVGQFEFTPNDELLYTTVNNSSVVARAFDLSSQSSETLFSTPFREAFVDFGSDIDGPHYFWPKTSHLLEGFVYKVSGGSFTRLPVDGFGLSANTFDELVLASYRDGSDLVTTLYNNTLSEPKLLETALIPDKCVASDKSLYCALPKNTTLQYKDIDQWFQGVESFTDNLWLISDESNQELIDITGHSGRNVDVKNGTIGNTSNDWYFQNKLDNTLWIYELSRLDQDNTDNL